MCVVGLCVCCRPSLFFGPSPSPLLRSAPSLRTPTPPSSFPPPRLSLESLTLLVSCCSVRTEVRRPGCVCSSPGQSPVPVSKSATRSIPNSSGATPGRAKRSREREMVDEYPDVIAIDRSGPCRPCSGAGTHSRAAGRHPTSAPKGDSCERRAWIVSHTRRTTRSSSECGHGGTTGHLPAYCAAGRRGRQATLPIVSRVFAKRPSLRHRSSPRNPSPNNHRALL